MKLLIKILALFLFLVGNLLNMKAQSYYMEAGIPFIRNYSSKEYGAHSQNFAIAKDNNGVMYFGNFMGILQFDGTNWNTLLTTNISKVSSLAADSMGKIYVGARGEFGYLQPDATGVMSFVAMSTDSIIQNTKFGEIKHIFKKDKDIYFISQNHVIINREEELEVIEIKNSILSAFLCQGKLFCQVENIGLTEFNNKKLQPIVGGEIFKGAIDIKSILQYNLNEFIVATDIQGLFIIRPNGIYEFSTEATNYLIRNNLTCGTKLFDNSYAFGTQRGGIVNINPDGTLKQIISKNTGLQSNYVNYLLPGKNSLWAALNNGLARIETPSPLSYHSETSGLKGSVLHIGKYSGSLYVGTYNGLFYQNKATALFAPINGINSACWSFVNTDNCLLAATSKGIFQICSQTVNQINADFALCIHLSKKEANKAYVGTTSGVIIIEKTGNNWMERERIKGIEQEIREISEDQNGMLWFISPSNGLYSYDPSSNKTQDYGIKDGLPSLYGTHFCKLKNRHTVVSTINGLYKFDGSSNIFKRYFIDELDSSFANKWYSLVYEEKEGSIWTINGDETSISQYIKGIDQASYNANSAAFKQIADFVIWDMYFDGNNITWLGGPDGLIRFQNNIRSNYKNKFEVIFGNIVTNNDSLLFGGYNLNSIHKDSIIQSNSKIPKLKYGSNISFSYSGISFNYKEVMEYRYFLEGFDDGWSEWSEASGKEYTNLAGGNYIFHVQARDIFGNLSKKSIFKFSVLTPWYLKWWAYIIYFLIFSGIVYLIVRWRLGKLAREKQILENLVQERTAEISEQKEEIERQSRGIASKNYELEKINFIVKSINAEIDLTNMLHSILEKTKVIRGVEKATALIFDKTSGKYMFKASYGWDLSAMGLSEIKLSQDEAEIRYIEGTEEIYEDVFYAKEVKYSKAIEVLDSLEKPKSKLVLILKIENHVEGFVLLENMHKKNAFTDEDLSLVKNLKEHIISAFIKAKILQDLQVTLQNLKETQEELIRQEKLASVGKLTKGIVDRVINPLNYINNFSNISGELIEEMNEILDEEKEKIPEETIEELKELISMTTGNMDKIKGHGTNAARIVKAMEGLLKDKSYNFIETNINSLLIKKVELAFKEAIAKYKYQNIVFTTELEKDASMVKIMHEEFGQMVNALIDNAFFIMIEKAKTQPDYKPEIHIKTEILDSNVIIRLKDNGTGMPQSEIDKVFDPFFTTKTTSDGTGLGLYMCKDIVEAHNGTLNVESIEGESTTFIIALPLEKEIHSHS